MTTSISDQEKYLKVCRDCISDEKEFSTFKSNPSYTEILEHVSYELGKEYYSYIQNNYPVLFKNLDSFSSNDLIGSPKRHPYGDGKYYSSTTLRYVKILGDILLKVPLDKNSRIVEIGAGYGGQCLILSKYSPFKSYSIIDLPPVMKLQEKYLQRNNVSNVSFLDFNKLEDLGEFDLCISNYAFSECSREVQEKYLEGIIKKSKHGYMICNFINDLFKLSSYSLKELLGSIPGSCNEEEVPFVFNKNTLVRW